MTAIAFTPLAKDDLELVREWRTRPDIARWMNTPGPMSAEAQRAWFERGRDDDSSEHYMVRVDSEPVGVINLADIDRRHRRASVGYYLGRPERVPIGALVMAYLLNDAFAREDLTLRKLTGEVLAANTRVLRMHEMLGYRRVGTLRDHVRKEDGWHDVVAWEILREDWLAQTRRFGRYVAPFR
jgi:UDP-4-amino-4,6-dideoxy-N-acetyl-beta-L-altrosamine N-acetyltransferase